MRVNRIICALLALAMLSMAAGALAEGTAILFPIKAGMITEGRTVTLRPGLVGLKLSDLTWGSSNPEVLVTHGNTVTALKPGIAILGAKAGSAVAKCGVLVLPAQIRLEAGERYELPRGGVEEYRMKDEAIASVDGTGVVTGLQAGETLLGIRLGKQIAKIPVTVTGKAEQAADGSLPGGLNLPEDTAQVVLVRYKGGSDATLSIHEKRNGAWVQLYECGAYVGKNGVGKTVEGDNKTPLGVYNLTTPFGILDDPGAAMTYTKLTPYHYWCGTSDSGYYNQFIDERVIDRKHTSADEYLIEYKGVYNYCMFIDYNATGEAHKGSCIFLHCTGSTKSTAGCVAVPEHVMKKIIQWARTGVKIVILDK